MFQTLIVKIFPCANTESGILNVIDFAIINLALLEVYFSFKNHTTTKRTLQPYFAYHPAISYDKSFKNGNNYHLPVCLCYNVGIVI